MALWGQLGFQDACSPLMEQLIFFHDHAMLILVLIVSIVFYAFISFMSNSYSCRNILAGEEIETIWTVVPGILLVFLALPSLRLLYLLDEVLDTSLTVKVIGHQWYWSYEYSDFMEVSFDSYMVPTNELLEGDFRLLEVDNRMVVPLESSVRVLVTSADVIHSWAVPSLGVKVDAVPGRLNQISFFMSYPGVFFGQCSEICGANHSFMPIVVEGVEMEDFISWLVGNVSD
uniref:cytochrome c oxidase subunit II n=1 Tax=Cocculina enigmadonta TaxID=2729702 RepID=UPI00220434DA|nr:cytochrome c oxidase subunit II [Cocculina enigmadonta]UXN84350.1 cytochrome c oxidase subunit II [Cocculina enigmadonta]